MSTFNNKMTRLANAIRSKVGKSESMNLDEMATSVEGISGGIDTSDATATADEIFLGETSYANGAKVTGTFTIDNELSAQDTLISQIQNAVNSLPEVEEVTLQTKTVTPTTSAQNVVPDSGYDGLSKVTVNAMPTVTQATPSITVSSSGLITASATQTAGYVAAGTKSGTKQLTTQAAQTITPSTTDKTIASGRYLTGTQTIKGDANLKAENIAEGVSIFGITGTHSGGSGGSGGGSGETCTVTVTGTRTGTATCYYMDSGLNYAEASTTAMKTSVSIEVAKNSILILHTSTTYDASISVGSMQGNINGQLNGAASVNLYWFVINSDATINVLMGEPT